MHAAKFGPLAERTITPKRSRTWCECWFGTYPIPEVCCGCSSLATDHTRGGCRPVLRTCQDTVGDRSGGNRPKWILLVSYWSQAADRDDASQGIGVPSGPST